MKKEILKNEFKDEISKNNLKNIAKRFKVLSTSQIDDFWFNCGWTDSEKGSNKSLPSWRLEKIKSNMEFAQSQLENLFAETPKKQFIRAINLISNVKQEAKSKIETINREPVKGFRDYEGEEAQKRLEIKKILVETFEKYGFQPAETPIIEYEDFVIGENKQDEVISDVFKLQDKGKRNLALRYEFTFQLKRLAKNKKLPYKRYQIGEVFRDEPVSSSRFRQFTQCDVDTIGSSIKEEAEILALTNEILVNLGINPIILINNRKLLNEILDDLKIKSNREKILREIDKIDKIGEKEVKTNLKKLKAEKFLDVLKKGEKYFNKFEGYKEIICLIEYCKAYGVKVLFSPTVVRGLSYYNGSVFEVKAKSKEGVTKESIVAGGSYKIDNIQATGISFGLERLSLLAKIKDEKEKYLVVSLEQDREAIKLAQKLRLKDKLVNIYYGKPSKALEYANSKGIYKVIFVGSKEIKEKKFMVKDMGSGKESILKI